MRGLPELLLFSSVLARGEDCVEDVLGVVAALILRIGLQVLRGGARTFNCFLPEFETRTGLEYLTRLCGWLKLVGP